MTGGNAKSLALATAGVTLTNVGFLTCKGGSIRITKTNHSIKEHSKKERCNQGVGTVLKVVTQASLITAIH